jgi:prevent-host-death family protein
MKSVSFTTFRTNASALLDEVEQGETVIVLRHGKPVAEIHPAGSSVKKSPSWQRPGPRLVTKGDGLSAAILGERGREDVF